MGPGDRQIDRETEASERQTKCLMCRGIEGGGGVVTHLHTHFHICLAMKKQKTAKFTRTQDAPSRQEQGGREQAGGRPNVCQSK